MNVLPAGTPIIAGQANRVSEPAAPDFVVFTPIRRERIETNVDSYQDVVFTGSISGTTLTITAVAQGVIAVGAQVFGTGLVSGTGVQNVTITSLGSGSGGVGTYNINNPQNIASQTLSAGQSIILQPTKITMQLDVHGPTSSDNAQLISTLFRDEYATDFFAQACLNLNLPELAVAPLYADDPLQTVFVNAEDQMEFRYVVEAVIQANQSIIVPSQFAGNLNLNLIDVDATYPP